MNTNTNDPGREPTDAELLERMAYSVASSERGISNEVVDAAVARGREYLSGARPMPDTHTPDEVAQLRGRIAVLAALSELLMDLVMAVNPWGKPDETFPMVNGRQWFDYRSDIARSCIEHGHTAFLALERGNTSTEEVHAEFKRLWDGRKEEAVTLTARVAELEAEVTQLKNDSASWEKQADDRAGDAVQFASERDAALAECAEWRGLAKRAELYAKRCATGHGMDYAEHAEKWLADYDRATKEAPDA